MEFAKVEVALMEEAVAKATDASVRELNDLQLTLIGGGIGDPIGF